MLRSGNAIKSYSSLHILHWLVGVLSAPTTFEGLQVVYQWNFEAYYRYINCMQNFRLVARSEIFYHYTTLITLTKKSTGPLSLIEPSIIRSQQACRRAIDCLPCYTNIIM